MNHIAFSDFKALTTSKMREMLPLVITVNAEPLYVIEKIENVVAIGDLHPAVRTQLRAQEMKARKGMPSPLHVYAQKLEEPVLVDNIVEKVPPPVELPEIKFLEKLTGKKINPETLKIEKVEV